MRFTGPGFRHAGNKLPHPAMIDPEISQSYGFYYYYQVTLPANSQRTDAQLLDRDADFVWRGVNCLIGYATYIGVRFKDANGFYFSSEFITTSLMWHFHTNGPFITLPVWPEVQLPAGGAIYMDLKNESVNPVIVGLLFSGAKKFSTPRT